ncbi:cytochrome P450 [Flammula alnicola]|nr:cytochrome P450 [Flammula alnicola]
MLLWRFVGRTNVILSNREAWTRHSLVVKSALSRHLPIAEFVSLSRKLFNEMANGGLIKWNDYTMVSFVFVAFSGSISEEKDTCSVLLLMLWVGTTALGHNFRAIKNDHSPFVRRHNEVMDRIASPPYIVFPKLEKWFPRRLVTQNIDNLVSKFQNILEHKKENKANDMLTYMLEEPGMTDEESRDNMVVFFITGHDTSAGAMSSFVYYLAKNPAIQKRAREEVLSALGDDEVDVATLRNMNFVQACIRESCELTGTNWAPVCAVSGCSLRIAVVEVAYIHTLARPT